MLFANFAEAMAEGRGKAQADTLRQARRERRSPRNSAQSTRPASIMPSGTVSSSDCDTFSAVSANLLKKGDVVLVEAGDIIPADGEVIEGVASVDESAITGESAPVIRESGGDRSASPAARGCSPTGWSCASPPIRARAFSTA